MSTGQPKVYGYCRASLKSQVESPEVQKEAIARYAEYHQLTNLTYFVDAGKSGSIPIDERPAGRDLMARLMPGDHMIIMKLDRAFRRLGDCVQVLDRFERQGIKLHVCDFQGGAVDLSSAIGRFIIHVLACFAEMERRFISERTKAGLANLKRREVALGRYPPYGFKFAKRWKDGKLCRVTISDTEEREVMRSIVDWRMNHNQSWDNLRQHLCYGLKIKLKDGREWNESRIRRAFRAELILQLKEQRVHRLTDKEKKAIGDKT